MNLSSINNLMNYNYKVYISNNYNKGVFNKIYILNIKKKQNVYVVINIYIYI